LREKAVSKRRHYTPLPDGVTIADSGIHGLGVFAQRSFSAGHEFGITHVADERFEDGYIRTPLGGFYNHSEDPNCEVVTANSIRKLYSTRTIQAGDEITARYLLYDPTQT